MNRKRKRIVFCMGIGLFLMSGLFMSQAVSVASATEAVYIEFPSAETIEQANEAAMSTGTVIAERQKTKLAQDAAEREAQLSNGMVRVLDKTKPMIALTFDDGPNSAVTGRIMAALEKVNGRGTFFVVGGRVGHDGATIRRMAEGGHEIGNHSYSHKNFSKSSVNVIQNEVLGTQNAVAAALGQKYAYAIPKLARIPYGANNSDVGKAVGMPMIQWSVDTKDWSTKNTSKTVSAILNNAKDGDIILMHDLYEQTAEASEKVIPQLVAKGFQLVTVDELFAAKGIKLQSGVMYFKAK